MTVRGRVVIVTGVSRRGGIGAAIARRLAAEGARLFLTGWAPHDATQPWGEDPGGGDGVVEELRRDGARVEHLTADLADPAPPTEAGGDDLRGRRRRPSRDLHATGPDPGSRRR